MSETILSSSYGALDAAALGLFTRKEGRRRPAATSQRERVFGAPGEQIVADFSGKPFDQLLILDLACGEGLYDIYPHRAHLPTKIKCFVEFLENSFGKAKGND